MKCGIFMNTRDSDEHPERVDEWEACVRASVAACDYPRAASDAIRRYGPEVMRFMLARLRDRTQVDEAFSRFCVDVWLGLPGFGWRSSLRTWIFVLARNACARMRRDQQLEQKRYVPQEHSAVENVCARVRTETVSYLRTETKHRIRVLRGQLDEDQQTLLVLRIERGLSWRELAVVMGEASLDAAETELERASARVRTRYQAAKKRLRALAVQAGLMTEDKRVQLS